MIPRLAAVPAAVAALLAGLAGGPARTGLLGIDWPDWGERLELEDLRHALEIHPPVAVERWLFNSRERTGLGLDRLETEGAAEALAAFETAGRLAPDDRRVLFNLGTARLLADHGDAVTALERAVDATEAAPGRPLGPRSSQRAFYNLGLARLAGDDPAGAVAAFEEALRRDPGDADAKFNLELALRRLEAERFRLRPPREAPDGRRPGDEEPSDEPGGAEPGAEREAVRGSGLEPRSEGAEAETAAGERGTLPRRPLAGFEEQPDLSAAQAAALLDAVETLERDQRRLEAARAAQATGRAEEEDW